jgi:hypothetical protein
MKPIFKVLLGVFLFVMTITPVMAHGTGTSLPKDLEKFTVELEYDEKEIISGTPTAFSFRLLDKTTGAGVHFDSVIARFEMKDDRSSFLTAKISEDDLVDGLARLTATPAEGTYVISLNFKEGEESLAEAEYEIAVATPAESKSFAPDDMTIGLTLGGLVAGFVLGRLLFRNKSSK